MRTRRSPIVFAQLCIALGVPAGLHAAAETPNIQPGAWRVAVAMEVPNATGPSTGPAQYDRCISANDARTLMLVPDGAGCTMLESKVSAQNFTWTLRCSQAGFASTARGHIQFDKTKLHGTIETVAEGRNDLRITTRLSGRYLGPCVFPDKPSAAASAPPKTTLPDYR